MNLLADTQILLKLLRGMPQSGDHSSRLEGFYGGQAEAYDNFRERLLHGRQMLFEQLQLPENASLVELGGGTGRNVEFLGDRLSLVSRYEVVDLCPSLLAVAKKRAQRFPVINVVNADACNYQPSDKVDCVIFSYSLTMIPDWEAAINNAKAMLKPNGVLVVVDFTLSPDQPKWLSSFWRRWFGHDGVHLTMRHYQTLQRLFPEGRVTLAKAKVPYLPFLRVPYYRFYSA